MTEVRIKICGLTRAADVAACVAEHVDAVGLVFTESPRQVELGTARALVRDLLGAARVVGLFIDPARHEVDRVLEQVGLDMLQFHGAEDNTFCQAFGLPFIKAIPAGGDAADRARQYPDASGILIDSHVAGGRGGTGRTFDWSLVPRCTQPLWLAGGLTEHNVARAISRVQPAWVDVSSGVEEAPGVKSHERLRAFVAAVRSARPVGSQREERH